MTSLQTTHLPARQPPSQNLQLFNSAANTHLSRLRAAHDAQLAAGDDVALAATIKSARSIREAAVVYAAAVDILALDTSTSAARNYLSGLLPRMDTSLAAPDFAHLSSLAEAGRAVLDGLAAPDGSMFDRVDANPLAAAAARSGEDVEPSASFSGGDRAEGDQDGGSRATVAPAAWAAAASKRRRCCGLSCTGLSRRDRLVLWLYAFMVLAALAAVTAVTVDFASQQINPGSFIRSRISSEGLAAPVVTVCLSQTGVPFSRLQLFNFTDAEGRVFRGADPRGPQTERVSKEFANVVDRFWDNPDNEKCDEKVGDFYPFPLRSLQRLVNGEESTSCRPCYRVGARAKAVARSSDFRNSSILSFYTDNYFLQCLKTERGLNEKSLTFLHEQMFANRMAMENLSVLSSDTASGVQPVSELKLEDFAKVTAEQACNIFYFSFFPKKLEREAEGDAKVDISYRYDGDKWERNGSGPYFQTLKNATSFLPEESLQMFVETNGTARPGTLTGRDMVLIGPNTQTYATFRPVIVYNDERYDVSSSTSNFVQSNVTPIFGYWLVYKIFYNFNRFVTDEYYQESTYPASQWIVDLTGYASLFTGASLFSLLLLPLLRAMRRRERERLLQRKPEAYVWAKHRRRFREADAFETELNDEDVGMKNSTVMLPGYNV